MALQGDSYPIRFFIFSRDIKKKEKILYTSEDIEAAQFSIGSIFKEYPSEGVTFDDETSSFNVRVKEEETFKLKGDVQVQIRVKMTDGNIIGKDLGLMTFNVSLSKVEMEPVHK